MTTIENAKLSRTPYFIEYVCDDLNNTYWQLVRTRDVAILSTSRDLNDLVAACVIIRTDVTIW